VKLRAIDGRRQRMLNEAMKLLIDALAEYQRAQRKPSAPILVHAIVKEAEETSYKTAQSRHLVVELGRALTPLGVASALNSDPNRIAVFPVVKRQGGIFPDRVGLGRTRNADIVIPYSHISKYHAYFSLSGETWTITDAGSKNGTTVDGGRVGKESIVLSSGQVITFGRAAVQFYLPDHFVELLEQLLRLGVSKRV